MAMRRTLFVFAREDIPTIQASVSSDIAATLRRRLISQLERNGTDPPIERDIARWLADLEVGVERAPANIGPTPVVGRRDHRLMGDHPQL